MKPKTKLAEYYLTPSCADGRKIKYDGKEYTDMSNGCKVVGMLCGEKREKNDEFNRRVYDTDADAPVLTAVSGGNQERKILEPITLNPKGADGKHPSLANRVYSQNGASIACCTSDFFMGKIAEPTGMRLARTEECKAKRRECHDVGMSFKDGKYAEPRPDGLIGTITTLDKDSMLAEPRIAASRGRGENYTQRLEIGGTESNTLTSVEKDNCLVEPQTPNFRIRKLTETECMRLMGIKDIDSERVHQHQSKSSMYHLAGDSIVTSVLMAIFGELLGVEWHSKVDALTADLSKESRGNQ